MNYRVVYDIQEVMYPGWWIFVAGILFISVGLGIIFFSDSKLVNSLIEPSAKQRMVMPIVSCIFGSLWIGFGIIHYSGFARLRTAARDGYAQIVEGKVEQFVSAPRGREQETFIVNGQYFAYSYYDLTKGFNKTQSHGGPMREGLQVRITHLDGSIVKLEIAE